MKTKKEKPTTALSMYKNPVYEIYDNIIFTKTGVWAYYIVPEIMYDFLSFNHKLSLANSQMQSFASLIRKPNEAIECHLLITTFAFDPNKWEEQMLKAYNDWNENENIMIMDEEDWNPSKSRELFDKYVFETKQDLLLENYQKRMTFLGIKLLKRGDISVQLNPFETGLKEFTKNIEKKILNIFKIPTEIISNEEEEHAKKIEESFFNTLSNGSLRVIRPQAKELLLAMKKQYYPSMPVPNLLTDYDSRINLNEIIVELGGIIDVKPKFMKFTNQFFSKELSGFRSTLTISRMPRNLTVPSYNTEPLFYKPSVLNTTCSARFLLTPTEQMKKNYYKKRLQMKDEIANISKSGADPESDIGQRINELDILQGELEGENLPWVTGSYRITVTSSEEDILKELVSNLIQEFAEQDTILTQTNGDQLQLFQEEQIGGEILIKDFQQITNVAHLSALGINFGNDVGDPIGE